MKYCGIDYGTKRIGIALSNDEGTIAFPEITLQNNIHVYEAIIQLAEKNNIDIFVIGESRMGDGQENKVNAHIKKFANMLEKKSEKKVLYQNEWGSSLAAQAHYFGKGNIANEKWTGNKNKQKHEHNDANAATIILQRYLDKK